MQPLLALTLALSAGNPHVTLDQKLDEALARTRAAALASTPPATLAAPSEAAEPATTAAPSKARTERATAIAPRESEPLTLKATDTGGGTSWIGGGLLLVIASVAALWLRKKKSALAVSPLRVVHHVGLGKGRDLFVVDRDGRELLLGVTNGSITLLQEDETRDGTGPLLRAGTAAQSIAPAAGRPAPRPHGIAAFESELERAGVPLGKDDFESARSALLAPRDEGEALKQKLGRTL